METLINVESVLGTGLHEHHVVFLSVFLSFISAHLSIVFKIRLVSNKHDFDIRRAIDLHLIQPVLDIFETPRVSNVINKHDTVASLVVSACDSFESSYC